jgi:hypothetical protein
MLAFNRSILYKEYILINVLKVLASNISMCNLYVILYRSLHRDILHYLQMEYFVHLV